MSTLTELMVASAVIGTNVSAVKTQIAAFTTFLWITPAPPVVTNSPPVTQGALAMRWGSSGPIGDSRRAARGFEDHALESAQD